MNKMENQKNDKNKVVKALIVATVIIALIGIGCSVYAIIVAITQPVPGDYGLLANVIFFIVGIIGLFITYALLLLVWGIYGLIMYYKTLEDNSKKTLVIVTVSIIVLIVIRFLMTIIPIFV